MYVVHPSTPELAIYATLTLHSANVQFNQTVRPRFLVLQTAAEHISQGPKLIKLFINRPAIGFEDVEDAKEPDAAQVIELTEEQVKEGKPIPLRFVRFQSVSILHVSVYLLSAFRHKMFKAMIQIFVQSNFGDEDATRIDAVDVLGTPSLYACLAYVMIPANSFLFSDHRSGGAREVVMTEDGTQQ